MKKLLASVSCVLVALGAVAELSAQGLLLGDENAGVIGGGTNAGDELPAHAGSSANAGNENSGTANLDECRFKEPSLIEKNGVGDRSLDYFISAEGNNTYYIAGSQNWLKDLTEQTSVAIPGSIDPVPTPDGKWLTVPGMSFYNMKDILAKKAAGEDASNVPAVVDDGGLSGVYQSIGQMPARNGNDVYRVITDTNGVTFQDYEANQGNGGDVPASVKPVHAAGGQRMCPDMDSSEMQMPMLSKDGRYLSLYSAQDRATKIFEIEEGTWKCREVLNLGFPTGKVDFNFDNSKLTFHVDAFDLHTGYFSGVDEHMTKDIYTVDLTKDSNGKINGAKTISRLSFSGRKGSGTYYPRFNKAGKIMAARDEDNAYSISTFNPDFGYKMPFWSPTGSVPQSSRDAVARYALGALWNKTCAKEGYAFDSVTEAAFAALSLDPKACRELAKKHWATRQEEIKTQLRAVQGMQANFLDELNEDALLAACPALDHVGHEGEVPVRGELLASRYNIKQILSGRCQECHTGAWEDPNSGRKAPFIDFTQPLTLDRVKMSRRMINLRPGHRYRMPPNGAGQLADEETQILNDYLNAREAELLGN
jgi:hypothetical protein